MQHSMWSSFFIKGVIIDWTKIEQNSYLRNITAISGVEQISFSNPITFFVGENASGKSTLLEAIAVADGFNPEGGTRNYNFSTYDLHSELCDAMRLIRGYSKPEWGYFLRAESFLAIAQSNFKGNGLYLLDEPEAALSPQRQLSLLFEIVECAKNNSQCFFYYLCYGRCSLPLYL